MELNSSRRRFAVGWCVARECSGFCKGEVRAWDATVGGEEEEAIRYEPITTASRTTDEAGYKQRDRVSNL
jgi:hypothetical protein